MPNILHFCHRTFFVDCHIGICPPSVVTEHSKECCSAKSACVKLGTLTSLVWYHMCVVKQASTQGLVKELQEQGRAEGMRVLCPVPLVAGGLVEPPVVPKFLKALGVRCWCRCCMQSIVYVCTYACVYEATLTLTPPTPHMPHAIGFHIRLSKRVNHSSSNFTASVPNTSAG